MFKFRNGSIDESVYTSVLVYNEYRLPETFAPEAIIIDVGAHIGSFSLAVLQRGSKRVYAVEPDQSNIKILRDHLGQFLGDGTLVLWETAVWGKEPTAYSLTEYEQMPCGTINTGSAQLIPGDGGLKKSISLDHLIREVGGPVELLKLDCEGSEWPALFEADHLSNVKHICGELHRPPESFLVDTDKENLKSRFAEMLDSKGFRCSFQNIYLPPSEEVVLGLFNAERI